MIPFENYVAPSWDEMFFKHVYLIASKSKDTRTKIGAILVKDKRIISEGYNGMCGKVNDNVLLRNIRPEKYFWYEHAERNSLYFAAKHGISTNGSIMYTNYTPCADCARGVIQAGITEVVIHKQWGDVEILLDQSKWLEQAERSNIMFTEAGVSVRIFDKILGVTGYLDGKMINI